MCLPVSQPGEPVAQSSPLSSPAPGNGSHGNGNSAAGAVPTATNAGDADLDERGRTRKKRDFFGTIKRKLGRSKSRAKSVDRSAGMIEINADNPTTASGELRSVSADRGTLNGSGAGAGVGGGVGGANSSGMYVCNACLAIVVYN